MAPSGKMIFRDGGGPSLLPMGGLLRPMAASSEAREERNYSKKVNLVLQQPLPPVPLRDVRPCQPSDPIPAVRSRISTWKRPPLAMTSSVCWPLVVRLLSLLPFDVCNDK